MLLQQQMQEVNPSWHIPLQLGCLSSVLHLTAITIGMAQLGPDTSHLFHRSFSGCSK